MATAFDNPAARLHSILQELTNLPPDTSVSKAVAQIVSSNTSTELALRISLLLSLPDQVVSEVQAVDEVISREILLRWYEPVSSALDSILFLSGAINEITIRYGEADLIALQMCSDLLHRHRREVLLSNTEVKHIIDLISDLKTAVVSSKDIDSPLREVLLSHISSMEHAIDEIPIRGTAGLYQAVAQTYGTLALRPDLVTKQKENTAIWQKLIAVLGAITAALSFGAATVQALEASPESSPISIVVVENLAAPIIPGTQLAINGPEAKP